jgi:hypothetical protein
MTGVWAAAWAPFTWATPPSLTSASGAASALGSGSTPPPVTGGQGRGMARHELRKPIYHQNDPSLLSRLLQKIHDWLNSLVSTGRDPVGTAQHGSSSGYVSLFVILGFLVAVAALAAWWLWRHRNAKSRSKALHEKESSAAEHRSAAQRLADAGKWAEAIRERLRGIARDLEERAILQPRPGRTADELAREAAPALPELAGDLAQGVRIFDDVWYGGRQGTREGYDFLTGLEHRIRKTKPKPLDEMEAV